MPAAGAVAYVDASEIGDMVVEVRITGERVWSLRLWLMMQCFKLAGIVGPRNVHVEVDAEAHT